MATQTRHAAASLPRYGLTLSRYARSVVQLDQFLAAASLLWPEIIQHDRGLFLADDFKASSFGACPRRGRLSCRPL